MRQTRQWVSMRSCPLRLLDVMILGQPMVSRRWLAPAFVVVQSAAWLMCTSVQSAFTS